MAITAQTVINLAIQRSALNNPDLVPTAQMLSYISNFEKAVYATGARNNPDFFGKSAATATRAAFDDTWDIGTTPGDVFALSSAVVLTIVLTPPGIIVGDSINFVGMRWPELEVAPRAYVRGGEISGVGSDLGDATNFVESLTISYSEMPSTITTTSQALTLGEEWSDLVIVPLARVLALRDHRSEDVGVLDMEYNSLMATFIDHVSVYDHGATRPLIAVPAATGQKPPAGAPVQPGAPRLFG